MKRFVLMLLVTVLVMAVIYLAVLSLVDIRSAWQAALRLTLAGWLILLSLSLANYFLRFLRWEIYIAHVSGHVVPRLRHLSIYIAGFALTTTPGKAGEAVRSIYLRPHGISYAQSFSVLFAERLVDILAVVLLSTLAALTLTHVRVYAVLALLIVFALIVVIRSGYLLRLVAWLAGHLPIRLARLAGHLQDMLASSSELLGSRFLYGGLLLGLVAWAAEGIGLYLILSYLGVDSITWPLAISIYAIAMLAGALSFIPGGLGAAEAVMGGLLFMLGVPAPEAAAATLICRLATLWFAIVLGIPPLTVLGMGHLESLTGRPKGVS